MKKFLAIISIVLIACMLMITPSFAQEEALPDFLPDVGQDVYYATKLAKPPRIDGKIEADIYGEPTVIKTEPNYWQSLYCDDTYAAAITDDPGEFADRTLKELKVWFAYDDKKIYFAYEQLGGAWDSNSDSDSIEGNNFDEYTFRHNNVARFGFDIENVSNLMQLDYGAPWDLINGVGSMTATQIKFTNGMPYAANDSAIIYEGKTPLSGAMIRKVHAKDGSPQAITNSKNGQYIETVELAFSKDRLLEAINETGDNDYAELPNAMFFGLYFRQYSWANEALDVVAYNGQTAWFSTPIDLDQQLELDTLAQYYPDIVVFGDKIETPVHEGDITEAPTTEVPTEAPETDSVTEAPVETSDEPQPEPAASGCGGTVSITGLALVSALGAIAVTTKKRRR